MESVASASFCCDSKTAKPNLLKNRVAYEPKYLMFEIIAVPGKICLTIFGDLLEHKVK